MQKIGIRKLMINSEDKRLEEILSQEVQNKEKYLATLIPQIIRKTRDPKKVNNLSSRYNRSIAYTERLMRNYESNSRYGVTNHVKHGQIAN